MPLKLEKGEKWTVFTKSFCITLSNLVEYVMVLWKWFVFWTLRFSAFTKTTDTFSKNKRCHVTLEGLSSVCVKLEPASSTNNEILEINVLQNLHRMLFIKLIFLNCMQVAHKSSQIYFQTDLIGFGSVKILALTVLGWNAKRFIGNCMKVIPLLVLHC